MVVLERPAAKLDSCSLQRDYGQCSAEVRAAGAAAADAAHRAAADGAFGWAAGHQVLPGAEDNVLERQTVGLEQPLPNAPSWRQS